MIISKRLKLSEPADIRSLIKDWIKTVCDTGELPFKGNTGGVTVQLLNTWLKAFEVEKLADVEKRLEALEARK
jgi:hypothetical protein